MPQRRTNSWIALAVSIIATVAVYAPGLHGPFLFDDSIHITQNRWVQIESITWSNLVQAWNSSFSGFPSNRPLAQVTFGINHAVSGLSTTGFKTTNLVLHLFSGLAVFVCARLVSQAANGSLLPRPRDNYVALVTAAFWLLHPLHVSTVLYVVQRMSQMSTLALFLATAVYLAGRLRMARGEPGLLLMLSAAPIAMIGFLGKENAVLLPLLLLACELTVLRCLPKARATQSVRIVQFAFIALPLALGTFYLTQHPGMLSYDARPFTLEERLLTQARVLWSYVYWIFVPDISALGLFHDAYPVSRALLEPPSTLLATLGLAILLMSAFWLRTRSPIFALAVLFFFASHALESSIFPLEMVFEHRNYLASFGPLLLLSHALVTAPLAERGRRAVRLLGILLLVAYAGATAVRVNNWSTYPEFLLTSAANHPESARANFSAAQYMIAAIDHAEGGDPSAIVKTAQSLLQRGLAADPNCINCLFGKLVLDLHLGRTPDRKNLDELLSQLRYGPVGSITVSVSQFGFLVKWVGSESGGIERKELEAIFDAALANPNWNPTGRASIEASYREYYRNVVGDLDLALTHAERAVEAWRGQWAHQIALARILVTMGKTQRASAVLVNAQRLAKNSLQRHEVRRLEEQMQQASIR